jgi:hypothetical protein
VAPPTSSVFVLESAARPTFKLTITRLDEVIFIMAMWTTTIIIALVLLWRGPLLWHWLISLLADFMRASSELADQLVNRPPWR